MACQERGYNCTVSTYDLSTIKNFIMPKKMRQRSVDGVVITGQVEPQVIKLFQAQQIPFVMVGDTTNFPLKDLLAIAPDMVTNWVNSFAHLAGFGHRHLMAPGFFDHDRRFPQSAGPGNPGLQKTSSGLPFDRRRSFHARHRRRSLPAGVRSRPGLGQGGFPDAGPTALVSP